MSETLAPATDLVSIEIDGRELAAPKGSMIIEAADKAGISIPRFCYHEKLSIAANCRMCLVDVEKAPKPLPACATPVMDGMKVYTQSKRALSAQQNVMEFLLINHPLDCPICDQGGECELQDLSMGFGRSVARFTERKRVVKDENLGSLISTDMTRCIHCTRCVRFLEEIAGTSELGGMGRGETMEISTFIGRSVDSELSGNVIDVCPVGALTNKPFRFSARAWELSARATVANFDCVGSNQFLHILRGRILRAVPRDNEAVNENWLSDRDRWGFHGLYADDRATQPLSRRDGQWQAISWTDALAEAAGLLRSATGENLGFLLSPNASSEELYLAQKMARALGCNNIDHRLRQQDFRDQQGAPLHPALGIPIAELSAAGAVLLVGSNIRHEAPILGHKVRQAARNGARIFAVNPREYDFNFAVEHAIVCTPSGMPLALAGIAKALGVRARGELGKLLKKATAGDREKAAAAALKEAPGATVLLGDYGVAHRCASILRALARKIASAAQANYSELPCGANGAGAWSVGAVPHRVAGGIACENPGLSCREMLVEPRSVYLLYDLEPELDCAAGRLASQALEKAGQVIYMGAFASEEVRRVAKLILPLAALPEVEGSLTNLEGVTQLSTAAGRLPGEARPGWRVLRALANVLELADFEYTRLEQLRDEIGTALEAEHSVAENGGDLAPASAPAGKGLEVSAEVPIYSGCSMLRRSQPLQDTVLGEAGSLRAHPDDLQRFGVAPGRVRVVGQDLTLEADLKADARVAPGSVMVPAGTPVGAALAAVLTVTLESLEA